MTTGEGNASTTHRPMADYDSDYLIKLYQNGSDNDIQPRITSYHFRWISYDLIISYFMIFMAFSFLLSYRLPTYRPTYRPTYWPTYLTCHLSICCLFVPMVHVHCISSSAPVAWLNVHSKKQASQDHGPLWTWYGLTSDIRIRFLLVPVPTFYSIYHVSCQIIINCKVKKTVVLVYWFAVKQLYY